MVEDVQKESLEERVFKALSNQKRRDVIRFIGEKKEATFTEIKDSSKVEDSPTVSYHLRTLDFLITQKDGKYSLSELGRDAYSLILKTSVSAQSSRLVSFLRSKLPLVIIANAILWATAIISASQFEGSLHQLTLSTFVVLWFISNIILYLILRRVKTAESADYART